MQGVKFVKLVRYGSRDSLTIDLGMAEVEGKKEKDEDFLVVFTTPSIRVRGGRSSY
jgi:hypothetical protein